MYILRFLFSMLISVLISNYVLANTVSKSCHNANNACSYSDFNQENPITLPNAQRIFFKFNGLPPKDKCIEGQCDKFNYSIIIRMKSDSNQTVVTDVSRTCHQSYYTWNKIDELEEAVEEFEQKNRSLVYSRAIDVITKLKSLIFSNNKQFSIDTSESKSFNRKEFNNIIINSDERNLPTGEYEILAKFLGYDGSNILSNNINECSDPYDVHKSRSWTKIGHFRVDALPVKCLAFQDQENNVQWQETDAGSWAAVGYKGNSCFSGYSKAQSAVRLFCDELGNWSGSSVGGEFISQTDQGSYCKKPCNVDRHEESKITWGAVNEIGPVYLNDQNSGSSGNLINEGDQYVDNKCFPNHEHDDSSASNKTRLCTKDGWANDVIGKCKTIKIVNCSSSSDYRTKTTWPETSANSSIYISDSAGTAYCQNGTQPVYENSSRKITRTCGANGSWGAIEGGECRPRCPRVSGYGLGISDGFAQWPETAASSWAQMTGCASGFSDHTTEVWRYCSSSGHWENETHVSNSKNSNIGGCYKKCPAFDGRTRGNSSANLGVDRNGRLIIGSTAYQEGFAYWEINQSRPWLKNGPLLYQEGMPETAKSCRSGYNRLPASSKYGAGPWRVCDITTGKWDYLITKIIHPETKVTLFEYSGVAGVCTPCSSSNLQQCDAHDRLDKGAYIPTPACWTSDYRENCDSPENFSVIITSSYIANITRSFESAFDKIN